MQLQNLSILIGLIAPRCPTPPLHLSVALGVSQTGSEQEQNEGDSASNGSPLSTCHFHCSPAGQSDEPSRWHAAALLSPRDQKRLPSRRTGAPFFLTWQQFLFDRYVFLCDSRGEMGVLSGRLKRNVVKNNAAL